MSLEKLEAAKKEAARRKKEALILEKMKEFVAKHFKGIPVKAISQGQNDGHLVPVGKKFVYKGYLKRDDLGYPVMLPKWVEPVNMEDYKKLIIFLRGKFEEEQKEGLFNVGEKDIQKDAFNSDDILKGKLDPKKDESPEEESFNFDEQYSNALSESSEGGAGLDEDNSESDSQDEGQGSNQFV